MLVYQRVTNVPKHQPVGGMLIPLNLKTSWLRGAHFCYVFLHQADISPAKYRFISSRNESLVIFGWPTNNKYRGGYEKSIQEWISWYHMDILSWLQRLAGIQRSRRTLWPKPPGLPQRERSRRSTTHPAGRYKCSTWRKAWIFGCFLREIWGVQPTKMWHKLWTYEGI